MENEQTTRIRCVKCVYYQITWDADKPYGCYKLGFKTKLEPANYVFQVSGELCQCFELKNLRQKQYN